MKTYAPKTKALAADVAIQEAVDRTGESWLRAARRWPTSSSASALVVVSEEAYTDPCAQDDDSTGFSEPLACGCRTVREHLAICLRSTP